MNASEIEVEEQCNREGSKKALYQNSDLNIDFGFEDDDAMSTISSVSGNKTGLYEMSESTDDDVSTNFLCDDNGANLNTLVGSRNDIMDCFKDVGEKKIAEKLVEPVHDDAVASTSQVSDEDASLCTDYHSDISVVSDGVEQVCFKDANEKREKAIEFIKEVMKKITSYSSFLHQRISNLSEEVTMAPVIKVKGKSRSRGYKNKEDQPLMFTNIGLHSHQVEAFKWLKTLYENGLNGILADEMGLGKTAVAIGLISHLICMGVQGPFLIGAPLSTVHNWCSEFERFAPEVPYILYHGNKDERKDLRSKIPVKVPVRNSECLPVVITSYEIMMADFKDLRDYTWAYVVIDEGHRLKNHKSKFFKIMKGYKIMSCLLMTGTPLQNDLTELWALMHLIFPEIFSDLEVFGDLIDIAMLSADDAEEVLVSQEKKNHLISSIHQILTPFMLRRTKKDVDFHIPPKKEVLVYCPLTELQLKYYRAAIDKTIEDVLKKETDHMINNCSEDDMLLKNLKSNVKEGLPKRKRRKLNYAEIEEHGLVECASKTDVEQKGSEKSVNAIIKLKTANILMLLRKICQHPYLVSFPLNPRTKELLIDEKLVKNSGKLMVLDVMLPELKRRGHKVLIFSQFVVMLDILADYCAMRKFEFSILTGQMKLCERSEEIQEFNTSKSAFLFLLSTRAGGLGLNLAAADTVIIFDSDWNPQCDLQAQDRCHRLGQEKPVAVYRLVTENTIDQRIIQKASTKRKLEKLIIKEGCFSTSDTLSKSQKTISADEIVSLLNSSDAKVSIRCNNKQVFTKKELDLILDRSDLSSEEPKSTVREVKGLFEVVS